MIPDSVSIIEQAAFHRCPCLVKVRLPSGLKCLPRFCFLTPPGRSVKPIEFFKKARAGTRDFPVISLALGFQKTSCF